MTVHPLMRMAAALTLLAACTEGPPSNDDGGTEVGDGDGDPSGDGDPTGDGDGDGDPTGDPSGGDGDGEPTGDGDGEPTGGDNDCAPEGTDYAYIGFGVQNLGVDQELDLDLLCSSNQIGSDVETGHVISLMDCTSQNGGVNHPLVQLMVNSNPATAPLPLVAPGDDLRLRYVGIPPFVGGRWFTLRSEPGGMLLLAGLYGPALLPWTDQDFDFEPLDVELVDIGCTPFSHPSGCGTAVAMGLEVSFGGDVATIDPQSFGYVGQLTSYQVITDWLFDFPQVTCDDHPDKILGALFFALPEG